MALSDAVGKKHYIYALPKEKIIEKIEEVDENLEGYIREAWKNHISDFVDTLAVLDLRTGKVDYVNYSPNLEPIFDPFIALFEISHRTSANTSSEDLYTDEELEELDEMLNNGDIGEHEEYAEKKGIDLDERYIENISGYIREDELGFGYSDLIEEVNRIYDCKNFFDNVLEL